MNQMSIASGVSTDFVLPTLRFSGDALFRVREVQPGAHQHATLKIEYAPSAEASKAWMAGGHSGPGVYACFWDDGLFYVGTYAGQEHLLRGNVAKERWSKHIAGMTFRGHNLGLSARWLNKIGQEHSSPLAQSLMQADRAHLSKDKGLQTQYKKFRFADRHWADFALLDEGMLHRFTFIYLRPTLAHSFAGMNKPALDRHLRIMESAIIKELDPPCNSKSAKLDGSLGMSLQSAAARMRTTMEIHIVQSGTRSTA